MKKWFPLIIVVILGAWGLSGLKPMPQKNGFDLKEFGRLPVLLNGRIQPFDSVAKNALLSMSGKSIVRVKEAQKLSGAKEVFGTLFGMYEKTEDGRWLVTTNKLSPTEWLLEAMTKPDVADTRKIFRAQNQDLETLLGSKQARLEYYSFNDITNHLEEIEEKAQALVKSEEGNKDAAKLRTPFQKDLMHLYDSMILNHRIKNSLQPEGAVDFSREIEVFKERIPAGLLALQASEAGEEYDKEDLQAIAGFFRRYQTMSRFAFPLAVPPKAGEPREAWSNVGNSLMESMRSNEIHPAVTHLAAIASAYSQDKPAEFNKAVADYRGWLQANGLVREVKKGGEEFTFNSLEPFYKASAIYVAALLLGCIYWINMSEWVRRSAFALLGLGFIIHTVGLLFRMYLEGRPPVTNLYSSAVFVGWGAVVLGMILEKIFKIGVPIVIASVAGFVTLIIAHHLSLAGDTMQMLQAVLDTNIWLSTHVVVITTGYASMFVAGLLAIIYILLGFFTPRITQPLTAKSASAISMTVGLAGGAHAGVTAAKMGKEAMASGETMGKMLSRMVYGIICFATLFSFVGTILGGIWADQSWGRFWGWDPKENGALLIVIWCAIVLHARWGGLVKERGIMALAVFGNIITSLSWFGVNMLGIGLHSYGFMDKAAFWLFSFIASQVLIILLALLPTRYWASFKSSGDSIPPSSSRGKEPQPASA